ncbi:efflux RND transporter periplasmic adaptor subunit [Rhodovulum sulfidophilum]|uniref:efflux RND transporter periplasmic adaptor subunit n=1 Tax=Rhodovulum sulfidophilum TaxID=35806 RepID=UPI0019240B8B|nr:efflux RND transporter periplasmic adaptor subunit [Rhodovulum sulfidophilum]MBL3561578.1 efflux RND transporter periplasmic adaptor subunit [Rhodovulum sulfidophilum]
MLITSLRGIRILGALPLLFASAPAGADQPLSVEILRIEARPSEITYTLTGTVQAVDDYPASFRDGGRIIEVAVETGDALERDDVIARVDATEAEARLRSAEAALQAAEAALVQARQARDRAANLLDEGNGTQSDLDAAVQAFLSARSDRDQASARRAVARRAAEDTVLRAIEPSIVIRRSAEPGQVVPAGQAVVTLANRGPRDAVFQVPDIPELDAFLGSDVRLSPLGGGRGCDAAVTELAPVVSGNGTVQAKVRIEVEAAGRFSIGQPVVGIVTLGRPTALVVPWTALTATADGPAVWTVGAEDNRVRLTPVTIDGYSDSGIRIAEGLSEGQAVVGAGSQYLFPGREVRPLETAK